MTGIRQAGHLNPRAEEARVASNDLLSILRCPACVGVEAGILERVKPSWLRCRDCSRKYPIVDTVAVMLVDEGDKWRSVAVDRLLEAERPTSDTPPTAREDT